jgi:hypothetical protein
VLGINAGADYRDAAATCESRKLPFTLIRQTVPEPSTPSMFHECDDFAAVVAHEQLLYSGLNPRRHFGIRFEGLAYKKLCRSLR